MKPDIQISPRFRAMSWHKRSSGFSQAFGISSGLILGIVGTAILVCVGLPMLMCGGCLTFVASTAPPTTTTQEPTPDKQKTKSLQVEQPGTKTRASQKTRTSNVPPAKEPSVRPPQPQSLRTWTSSDGDYKVEAKLLKFENRVVSIQKRDGKIVEMDIGKLSKADQDYIYVEMAKPRP